MHVGKGQVVRKEAQQIHVTTDGVSRRILCEDEERNIEIAINEYQPDTGNSDSRVHHPGYEYGLVLEGALNVDVNGTLYLLNPGDIISYDSNLPHRLWNNGESTTQTIWINLNRYVRK